VENFFNQISIEKVELMKVQ